jgi:hypothetical protein
VNELGIIDQMFGERMLTFQEASGCWRLVRSGHTAVSAVKTLMRIQRRKAEKQEKVVRVAQKKARQENITKMLQKLTLKAIESFQANATWQLWFCLYLPLDESSKEDAMRFIDDEATEEMNNPRISEDVLDLCYSNTDGAEVLF